MKKFVKYLLASTVLVGLLAGCSKQCPACPDNSSSGESSEPIVPVEVKEEWTEEELETFDDLYLEELPFAYELEITDYAGGVLFATSAKEASDEDVEAFGELLEEDDLYEAYNFSGLEESLDIAALGFDGDAYLYTRPYQDDVHYNLMNTVAIGLNEDGYLQVAMAATWAPLYLMTGGKIGGGSSFYGLLFEDDEAEVEEGEDPELFNFYEEYYAWAIESAFSLVKNAPSAAHPILETPVPEIEKDVTNGSLLNFAVAYPFTYGNINSNYFTPEYVVSFANFEGDSFVPFDEDDFNDLIGDVELLDNFYRLDGEEDPAIDPEPEPIRRDGEEEEAIEARFEAEIDGYTLLVIYSLDEVDFGSAGSGYGISVHFVYEDFVMQNRAEFVVSAVADALQSVSMEYQTGVYLTAAFFSIEEDATEDDFLDAFDEILYTLWIYDIISDEQFLSATIEYDEEHDEYVATIYLDSDEYRVFLQFELDQDEDEDGKYIACYIIGYEYTLEDYTNGCASDIYQYLQALISYGLLRSTNNLYGYIYGMIVLAQYASSFAAADTIEAEAFAFIDMYYSEQILYYAKDYLTGFLNMNPKDYYEDDWAVLEEAGTALGLAYEKYVEDEEAGIEHGMYDLLDLLLASIDYEDAFFSIETKSDKVDSMVEEKLDSILSSLSAGEYDDADWEGFQAIIDQAKEAMLAAATSDEAQEILDEAIENLIGAIKTALLAYLDRFYEENAEKWTDEELAELAYLDGKDAIKNAQTAASAEAAWVSAYQELADLIEPAG